MGFPCAKERISWMARPAGVFVAGNDDARHRIVGLPFPGQPVMRRRRCPRLRSSIAAPGPATPCVGTVFGGVEFVLPFAEEDWAPSIQVAVSRSVVSKFTDQGAKCAGKAGEVASRWDGEGFP
jgi:hypothetical protein